MSFIQIDDGWVNLEHVVGIIEQTGISNSDGRLFWVIETVTGSKLSATASREEVRGWLNRAGLISN